MGAYVILVVLAAFGALCTLWTLFGCLLPAHREGAVIYFCSADSEAEPLVRRHLWLYNTGLLRCPLLLVDTGLSPFTRQHLIECGHPIILCTCEELHTLIIQERIHLD